MSNTYFSLFLSFLAGICTLIGYFVIYLKKYDYNKLIIGSLAFASGVMITTSILDLIPESIRLLQHSFYFVIVILICFFSIMLGIVVSMIIDYFVPNKMTVDESTLLFRIGILSMIAIILHNIPEGIATFMATSSDKKLGISLAFAIAMHNIPEGITIAVPIFYSTSSKKMAFFYTLISSLSEPLGAILTSLFLKNIIDDLILGIILSVIAGIMLEISFRILLPNTWNYNKSMVFFFFTLGMLFMIISIFI